ncbi:ABC transporter ATP-binding protein [Staphylococcus intermedius]|uniref:ABC transporter ATP-binding protein n=1 Tax=Staphylococcus intermedius TaxID=1285 RepID=UPI000BBC56E7|nr:ABC transporter ATP-binding protein [Staphylococcus intermedius]PCF84958.1 antibiotic ABC transporter ATP-binding protein [Staphylococcus intermedius]
MIQISHLTQTYNQRHVVDDVSFQIHAGQCTALIGPNGSGKTTLIDMIIGDRHPVQGTIQDLDHLLTPERLGVMFQQSRFPERMKVIELYHLFAHCYHAPLTLEAWLNITRFTEAQLQQFATQLSGGQQRILDFALTLVGQPQCLILDEPTSAMDVEMRQHFWSVIRQLKAEGRTIFYTSHYIEEVEQMADRVIVLSQGRLVMDDTPQHIKQEQGRSFITLPTPPSEALLSQLSGVKLMPSDDGQLKIETADVQQTLIELLSLHVPLQHIEIHHHSLLDIIFKQDQGGVSQ